MALSVLNLMHGDTGTADIYFNQKWLRTLESMLDKFAANPNVSVLAVEPTMALRYQGDLYGLLTAQHVPSKYHWLTMRLNGFTSPDQYTGEERSFLIPSSEQVEENRQMFQTMFRKSI